MAHPSMPAPHPAPTSIPRCTPRSQLSSPSPLAAAGPPPCGAPAGRAAPPPRPRTHPPPAQSPPGPCGGQSGGGESQPLITGLQGGKPPSPHRNHHHNGLVPGGRQRPGEGQQGQKGEGRPPDRHLDGDGRSGGGLGCSKLASNRREQGGTIGQVQRAASVSTRFSQLCGSSNVALSAVFATSHSNAGCADSDSPVS